MPRDLFFDWFYRRLSTTFGHIAHYNKNGFYEEWFSNPSDKRDFLARTLNHTVYGDPDWTYADVERAVQDWLEANAARIFTPLISQSLVETEARERALLAELKDKYEGATA